MTHGQGRQENPSQALGRRENPSQAPGTLLAGSVRLGGLLPLKFELCKASFAPLATEEGVAKMCWSIQVPAKWLRVLAVAVPTGILL